MYLLHSCTQNSALLADGENVLRIASRASQILGDAILSAHLQQIKAAQDQVVKQRENIEKLRRTESETTWPAEAQQKITGLEQQVCELMSKVTSMQAMQESTQVQLVSEKERSAKLAEDVSRAHAVIATLEQQNVVLLKQAGDARAHESSMQAQLATTRDQLRIAHARYAASVAASAPLASTAAAPTASSSSSSTTVRSGGGFFFGSDPFASLAPSPLSATSSPSTSPTSLKHCPSGHRLRRSSGPRTGSTLNITCDLCGMKKLDSVLAMTPYYSCVACNWDACYMCHSEMTS